MYVFIECTLHLKHISTITREEATADRPGVGGWVCILCCRRNHSMANDIDDEKCARPGEMHVRSRTNDGTDWIVRLRPKGIYFYIFNIHLERGIAGTATVAGWHGPLMGALFCAVSRRVALCSGALDSASDADEWCLFSLTMFGELLCYLPSHRFGELDGHRHGKVILWCELE